MSSNWTWSNREQYQQCPLYVCIYIPGKPEFCFYYCAVYDECTWSDTFWLANRLFVHYIISLSSLCKLIWRHWTHKMSARIILSSLWVRLSIFSQLSIIIYMGLYVFSLPISLVMINIIHVLLIFIIISDVWTFIHCLGHETMICAVCFSIFLCIYAKFHISVIN